MKNRQIDARIMMQHASLVLHPAARWFPSENGCFVALLRLFGLYPDRRLGKISRPIDLEKVGCFWKLKMELPAWFKNSNLQRNKTLVMGIALALLIASSNAQISVLTDCMRFS
jgi:hypothetical protein